MATSAREKKAVRQQFNQLREAYEAKLAAKDKQIAALAARPAPVAANTELDALYIANKKLEETVQQLKGEINQLDAKLAKASKPAPAPKAKPAKAQPFPSIAQPSPAPTAPQRVKKTCKSKKCDWSGRIRGNKCPKCHAKLT